MELPAFDTAEVVSHRSSHSLEAGDLFTEPAHRELDLLFASRSQHSRTTLNFGQEPPALVAPSVMDSLGSYVSTNLVTQELRDDRHTDGAMLNLA